MLGLLLVAAIPFGAVVFVSLALGGAIELVNLRLLDKSVGWMLGTAGGRGGVVQALLILRFFLLMTALAATLLFLPVDPLAFTIGFSSVVPAAIWHGLMPVRPRIGEV